MKWCKITKRAKDGSVILLNSDDETLIELGWFCEGKWMVQSGASYNEDRFTH